MVLILGTVGISLTALIAYGDEVGDSYNTFIRMALGRWRNLFLGVFKRPDEHSGLIGALVGFLAVLAIHFARSSSSIDLWPVLNGLISFCVRVLVGGLVGVFVRPAH